MKILVDADACPVKGIITECARKYDLKVIMFCDTSHILNDGYSEIVTVDKSADSADFALVNRIEKGDIVVTQDFGVAAMAMSKNAKAINNNGMIFDNSNMDKLLFERFLSAKVRRSGQRTKGISKRTNNDNINFKENFISLIEERK